jgi:hypothetical protein
MNIDIVHLGTEETRTFQVEVVPRAGENLLVADETAAGVRRDSYVVSNVSHVARYTKKGGFEHTIIVYVRYHES